MVQGNKTNIMFFIIILYLYTNNFIRFLIGPGVSMINDLEVEVSIPCTFTVLNVN